LFEWIVGIAQSDAPGIDDGARRADDDGGAQRADERGIVDDRLQATDADHPTRLADDAELVAARHEHGGTDMKIGYSLSSEQFGPGELVEQAQQARDAGFEALAISDHFHPWNAAQGESPFVWSVIGALSQAAPNLSVTTLVTCPILRINPVILAQAAATSSLLLDGRFRFGVGTGENLNEHVWGAPWPPAKERLDRLREAVELMRRLWDGGNVDFDGRYYRAVNARVYSLPAEPPPVFVSGLAPLATELAAEIGDGFVTMKPDLVSHYRESGGKGAILTGVKACFDVDEDAALDTAHRLWGMELNPGQLNRELATPSMIESAQSLISRDAVGEEMACGPDPARHIDALQQRLDAGYDEVFVQQVGPDMKGFFALYADEVLPHFAES
jgi:G6PDH family F420-dependent oxidoreductase